jgi:hypothetical protein
MSTHDYVQRAFRRISQTRTGAPGNLIQDEEGNCAVFWLQAPQGLISAAQYRCTTCAALLAFCEHLSELAVGMPIEQASEYQADNLIALHPDIPKYKSNRAKLASEAFRSAVQQITLGATD